MTTDIDTFKRLYCQEFGTDLTDEEAEKRASQLKRVYVAVYGSPVITKANEPEEDSNTR
jgi:hypothetical protein